MDKNIIILYHSKCSDGFGAAWAAYKKFGDTAEYIPVDDRITPPEGLENKEVYIVDFSYPKEVLIELEKQTRKLVVLDHHISSKEDVEAVAEHVFDNEHSGAMLTWQYLFPNEEPPFLLKLIEDNDLWRFDIPETQPIIKILEITPFEFTEWDSFAAELEDKTTCSKLVEKGTLYKEYWDALIEDLSSSAKEVVFEGYHVYAINVHGLFRSQLGNILANRKPPFAILWGHKDDGALTFSLRGDGSVNLAEIAKKYGGGGHHDAAAFRILDSVTLPFTFIEKEE